MTKTARILLAIASVLLLAGLVTPLWSISLIAPQYPEGLGMRIHANSVEGKTEHDLQNINELNHYIGMKAIEPTAIPELRYMPWIVAALGGAGLLVAIMGRRRALYAWLASFAVLGALGMYDMWRWMYDYGHNLDMEHAIIIVPGMSYQPPLIGTKQLLNFTASSWPALGGWFVFLAFAIGACALFQSVRAGRRAPRAA